MKDFEHKHNRLGFGIIIQLYRVIIAGLLLVTLVSFFSQKRLAEKDTIKDYYSLSNAISQETIEAVREYPASHWLLSYWYHNADTLDPEYDVDYGTGTETKDKSLYLSEKYPEMNINYATEEELEAMPEEDQKLYAEVVYSWLGTRINQIKSSYQIDYLYCIATDMETEEAYHSQFFLFSAASPDSTRGTDPYNVFTLGVELSTENSPSTQEAMRKAVLQEKNEYVPKDTSNMEFDLDGRYLDQYAWLDNIGENAVLIGTSFSMEEANAETMSQTGRGVLYFTIYMFFFLNILLGFIFVVVISPTKTIQKAVRKYTRDKKSKDVQNSLMEIMNTTFGSMIRRNEIGELSVDLIQMTEEIDDYVRQIQTITAERDRIEVELNLAARIQANMLPPAHPVFKDRSDLEICALMDPAREVGGDFYDYFMIDDDHLALVIADVSGKGVPAAMFMTVSRTLIKTQTQYTMSPAEIFYAVNNELCDDNKANLFVTVWMAIIDLSTGKGVASNAGHEHPAVCRAGGRFELVKYRHSPMIGGLSDVPYQEHTFELKPGDQIFVYTDGVPEADNPAEKLFGTDRMLSALNQDPDAPQEKQLSHLREEINIFADGADQFDDITMLLFRYHGNGHETEDTGKEPVDEE